MQGIGRNGGAALALGLTLAAGTAMAAPVIYPSGAQILRYSHAALSPEGQKALGWMRSEHYFGAMYVDSASGTPFAVRGYNNLQAALAVTLGWCRAEAKGACRLYATLTPPGFKGRRSSHNGLSQRFATRYRTRYLQKAQPGGHAAYAVSDLSAVGASWGRASAADADAAALDFCRSEVEKELARARPGVRRAIERAHLTSCHIVDRRG